MQACLSARSSSMSMSMFSIFTRRLKGSPHSFTSLGWSSSSSSITPFNSQRTFTTDSSSSSSSTAAATAIASQIDTPTKPKVLVISGPTGIGKSEIGIRMAQLLGGEIVSADSVQVYRRLNIGSNKGAMDRVPHHLFDILDFNDTFNVKSYLELAINAIDDIIARGRIPILVGGCGFYIHSVLNGINKTPLEGNIERGTLESIEARLRAENNWFRVASILKEIDPESAQTISRNDYRRMAKSFYVYAQTGTKYSEYKKIHDKSYDSNKYDFRAFHITARRDAVMHMLNYRCELMIQNGFIKEVVELLLDGLSPQSQVSNSIGYSQCINILLTPMEITMLDTINFLIEFQAQTRTYSRRQSIWFKKCKATRWLEMSPLPQEFSQFTQGTTLPKRSTLDVMLEQFYMDENTFANARNVEAEEMLKHMTRDQKKMCKETLHKFQLFTSENSFLPLRKVIMAGRSLLHKNRPELFGPELNPHLISEQKRKQQELLHSQLSGGADDSGEHIRQ
ncbi:hypothetical protein SAMD00019534_091190 [Acytostelium subglobosum LB1]|uniref:hypothetical protein n=1 Tax=Acytostelium subglobosum LB1 TaxID=1410327 RepID=UPI000644F686|nr:hypothetical protein SAMD00019534_091190 [Acytostelium subglobosum LB1]GAM25944.1 hypothetical protein SAMD00019534_091190 [Acytostelium subglobosum LB1]|eukprot:XP_012750987.1 hypothetical protein SAMD00019534_091190 [Acytostelium subglobosum LB1]